MRRTYYTEHGTVKALRAYHYLIFTRQGNRQQLTFAATDRTTADKYARAWARRRGIKIYRKKRRKQ